MNQSANANHNVVSFKFSDARNKKDVMLDGNVIKFEFDVHQIVVYESRVFVVLWPSQDAENQRRNVYCFQQGRQIWQIEDPNNEFPNGGNIPFVGILVTTDGSLIGTDFYGGRYCIDMATGAITKRMSSVRW